MLSADWLSGILFSGNVGHLHTPPKKSAKNKSERKIRRRSLLLLCAAAGSQPLGCGEGKSAVMQTSKRLPERVRVMDGVGGWTAWHNTQGLGWQSETLHTTLSTKPRL